MAVNYCLNEFHRFNVGNTDLTFPASKASSSEVPDIDPICRNINLTPPFSFSVRKQNIYIYLNFNFFYAQYSYTLSFLPYISNLIWYSTVTPSNRTLSYIYSNDVDAVMRHALSVVMPYLKNN